jgi:succinate dehydrogenase/fumarate reductase cytochrome b subunit
MIPSRHAPAAATAAAYLMILAVALPVCWSQARQTVNHLQRISGRAPREFLTMYVLVLAVAAVLFGVVNKSAFNPAPSLHPTPLYYAGEFAAFSAVTALGFVLSYLVMAYAYADALQEPGAHSSLSWAGTLAATAATGWLRGLRRSPAPAGNRYLDSGLLRLLGCAATIDMLGQEQSLAGPQTVRSVILTLELAAADIEQYAVDGVPRLDAATRRRARQDGVQLASVIRDAKAPVAHAVHPRNYLAVAIDLAGFLLAWARSDKSDFTTLTNNDAAVARVALWRRAASRVWNAALLAAAGVVLPLLPIYKTDHAAAAGLSLNPPMILKAHRRPPRSGPCYSFQAAAPGKCRCQQG